MKKVVVSFLFLVLIFMQIAASPVIHPDDPMIRYDDGTQGMQEGAEIGAAFYIATKFLGQTIGDTAFAKALRDKLPFMSYVIPPKGWLGWKEECLNLLGMTTLGAAIGSFGSGGELAQQFQFGFSDALSQRFITDTIGFMSGGEAFSTQPPFIDLVMVKIASQVIRDQLIPAGIPPFRGQSREVLILNGAEEITAMTLIGALEGAAVAALYQEVRDPNVNMREFLTQEMAIGATLRAIDALQTVVFLGPRLHVSESEKEKINAYAQSKGVDIRWSLDHAQFRDGRWSADRQQMLRENAYAYALDRHIVFMHPFDPKNNQDDTYAGAHEAYHLNQNAKAPNWIYLRVRYADYRRDSDVPDHDKQLYEQFPSINMK